MRHMNLNHKHGKHIGPGGITCKCCRVGRVRDTRIIINRRFRRASKIELKKEVD